MEGGQSKEQGWPGLVESTKRINIFGNACVTGMLSFAQNHPDNQQILKTALAEQGLLGDFSEDAIKWAETVRYPTVLIEGETWAIATEVARAKGVSPGDIQDNMELINASRVKYGMPPDAIQRMLAIPGTNEAKVSKSFLVKDGYAISCGGYGAKTGINALIKSQRPDWRPTARYTLINLPLQLSYLMHGRTAEAKATRDLTVGTTVKVAKVAAVQPNASMAVNHLAGNNEYNRLMVQLMQVVGADAYTAQGIAVKAESTASEAKQEVAELREEMKDLRAEVFKTDVERACLRHNIPHPREWTVASLKGGELSGPGLYWIVDPFGDIEKPHYVGESGDLHDRLCDKRSEHKCLRFLGATGRCYETRVFQKEGIGLGIKQNRTNIEDHLTGASQPHWKFNPTYQDTAKSLSQFKTKAYPLHNYQASMV